MSGLILAGLGKGIADAGLTFGNSLMKEYEAKRQDEREALREQRLLERQDALDRLKAERDEAKAEALKQRVSQESAAVGFKAEEIGKAREATQLGRDATKLSGISSQVAGDSPSTTDEEFKKLIEENPQYRETYRKAGLIDKAMTPNQQRIQRADDEATAALEMGAHSSVIDAYAKKRKDVLDQIREENKDARDTRREDRADEREARRDAEFRALMPIRQQNADANTTRAGAAVTSANKPSSGSNSADKPATTADIQRQVTAAQNGLATELGVAKNEINAEIKSIRKRADAGNAQAKATLERIQPMLDEFNSANQRMLQFKRVSPSTSNSRDNSTTRPPLSSFAR